MASKRAWIIVLLLACFTLIFGAVSCGTTEEADNGNDNGGSENNNTPTEDIAGPAGPYNLKSDGKASPTFTWDAASDPSGILRYVVRIDGGKWLDIGNTMTYQVNTSGLSAGAHTFEVKAVDTKSNPGNSYSLAFTCVASDKTAPAISNVASENMTEASATITWTTDEPSTSKVYYGPSSSTSASTAVDSSLVTKHRVTISGLSAGSFYYYYVESADAAGNKQTSSAETFYTSMQQNLAIGATAQNSEQKVTVRSANRVSSYKWGNNYTEHAAAGKTFIIVDLYVENIGDESFFAYSGDLSISDSENFKYEEWIYYGDGDFNSVELFPGQKTQGKVLFEIPTTATGLTIAYDFGFWSPNLATWVLP